jgi:hypothetical protein
MKHFHMRWHGVYSKGQGLALLGEQVRAGRGRFGVNQRVVVQGNMILTDQYREPTEVAHPFILQLHQPIELLGCQRHRVPRRE